MVRASGSNCVGLHLGCTVFLLPLLVRVRAVQLRAVATCVVLAVCLC